MPEDRSEASKDITKKENGHPMDFENLSSKLGLQDSNGSNKSDPDYNLDGKSLIEAYRLGIRFDQPIPLQSYLEKDLKLLKNKNNQDLSYEGLLLFSQVLVSSSLWKIGYFYVQYIGDKLTR